MIFHIARRRTCLLAMLTLLWAAILSQAALAATGTPVKRVLILNSFPSDFTYIGNLVPWFRSELARQWGQPIDFREVTSFEAVRYTTGELELALVEYLRNLFADRSPDLLVPVGAPALTFLQRHRQRLFPQTPIVMVGADVRGYRDDGPNVTAVGTRFDFKQSMEHILRILPDTATVAVVIGNSALEKYWLAELQNDLQALAKRVNLIWLNAVPLEALRDRVAALPRASALFYTIFLVDPADVPIEENRMLRLLHATASAPIFGLYSNQLGEGIVGGPLYPIEEIGRQAAQAANRVLRGEAPGTIQPRWFEASAPVYDFRELRHWGISEARLPPASIVRFREPTLWEQYRWYIVGALAIIAVQAVLIVGLLLQRVRRRRAEAELQESRELMELSTNAGELGLWVRDLKDGNVWANASLRSMFGFGLEEPLRIGDLLTRTHPDDSARVQSQVQRAQEEDLPFEGEFRILLPEGKELWVLAKGRTVNPSSSRGARRMGVVMDITERKRAEEALRERTERYELIIAGAQAAIWDWDVTNKRVMFSPQWKALRGYADEEVGDREEEWSSSIHPDDAPRVLAAVQAHFEGKTLGFAEDYRVRCKDGSWKWITDRGVALRDAAGRVVRMAGSENDITGRKVAEETIKKSEEFNRTVLASLHDHIAILDQNGTIISVNDVWKEFARQNGAPPSLVGVGVGVGYLNVCRQAAASGNETAGRALDGIHSVLGCVSESFGMEYSCDSPSESRWYLMRVLPLKSAEGGVVISHADITGRKQAEEMLRDERAFLRQVIDIDPNFVFAKDREGRFTLVNQAVAEAYGTTVAGLIGKTDADFNPNRDEVEHFHRMDLEVIDKLQERFIAEERLTDAQGEIRWLQTVKRPIIGKGGVANQVLGASTDITRRKQMEAELQQQREDLAHVTRVSLMGELTASLAHELNQPLTAILSNAQAAQRFLMNKAFNLDEVREILKDIVDDNNRAAEIIRKIRALARKEELTFAHLDLPAVIRDVLSLVRSDADLRNVQVDYQASDRVPAVRGDRTQLQQVMLNLFLNAFDAMEECATDERQVSVRVNSDDVGFVEVSVRDRGIGLTSDKLDRIFEPFFTTKKEGLGMGLSISRSIVEAHGGHLWAENNQDRGVTFHLVLPVFSDAEKISDIRL